jgi:hypothetical protein
MAWEDFVALISKENYGTNPAQPSRYGSMPDLYFAAILPSSAVKNIDAQSCFVTIGVSDLAGSAMFITEPNIIMMDWDKSVIHTSQTRMEEWATIFASEDYDPQKLLHNTKIMDNDFTFPYDFEFWERMNMALVEYYRKNNDLRVDQLQHELKVAHVTYTDLNEKLKLLKRGAQYVVNEFDRESMRENSVENNRLLLGERYFKLNCKIFFKHVDQSLLREFANKKIIYLNLNALKSDHLDKLISALQQAKLNITRINFTDMLDDIVVAPEKLQSFIIALEKLSTAMADNSVIIFNHINSFSLALKPELALLRLNMIQAEIANIKDEANISVAVLEGYAAKYLLSFKDHSVAYVDKDTFYS